MALINLTAAQNQALVKARQGDEIVLRLPENPTTGFRWHLEETGENLKLIGDSFELAQSPQIGQGGFRIFRFRVRAATPGRIKLKHWQEWEGDVSVTERFSVQIVPPR